MAPADPLPPDGRPRPPATPSREGTAAPTPAHERILELDVLRGVAIFGILVVNMMLFAHPAYVGVVGPPGEGWVDAVARGAIEVFAEAKFYTLFSLLFGIGTALQMRRAERAGRAFGPRYVRRLLVLLAFGAAHVALLWWGDILAIYAVLGFVLLRVRSVPTHRLTAWAAAFLLVPLVLNVGLAGIEEAVRATPEGARGLASAAADTRDAWRDGYRDAVRVYRGTDVLAMTAQRVRDWTVTTVGVVTSGFVFIVLAMFVLGQWVGRVARLDDLPRHRPFLRRVAAWGIAVGVPMNVASPLLEDAATGRWDPAFVAGLACYVIGAPLLSLGYASGIALLVGRPPWRARLRGVGDVGRMALTNYLLQSLVVTTLMYGYGFGLYGRIGPAAGLGLTVVVYALQVPLSAWWLRRFRFGPVEWLWRSLTYGHAQPMRRSGGARGHAPGVDRP